MLDSNKTPSRQNAKVALLIDGENIPVSFLGTVLQRAEQAGTLVVKRVYGNAAHLPGWDAAPGVRLIHSGSAKNGADILLSIEAADMAHTRDIDTFAVVTSDQDFSHLVHFLRERGFRVIGMGEPKAPAAFRDACSEFGELRSDKVQSAAKLEKIDKMDRQIHELISKTRNREMRINLLSARMNTDFKVQISKRPEKTWRNYLKSKPELYVCDPKGPNACVRLKS